MRALIHTRSGLPPVINLPSLPTMTRGRGESRLTPKLIGALYMRAMLLADEARAYFDRQGRGERDALDPLGRIAFSCESLKVTTRLMHVIAWLLTWRAVEQGEMAAIEPTPDNRRLGYAAPSNIGDVIGLPDEAIRLIDESQDLYDRILRLDAELAKDQKPGNPVAAMLEKLGSSI